jgi:hypothetical protein
MTLAVVNEKLVKVARSIVGKGRKRLEAAGKGEIRLDDAERAQTKLLMALAEEVLSHPASFACSPCLLMHQAAINATSEVITTFLVDLIGKRDPSTPDKSAS